MKIKYMIDFCLYSACFGWVMFWIVMFSVADSNVLYFSRLCIIHFMLYLVLVAVKSIKEEFK